MAAVAGGASAAAEFPLPTAVLRRMEAAVAPAAAMPPLTTASGRACARRGATRDAPAMATPASAILIVLPQDCGSAGRGIGVSARGERGAGPRRGSGRINSGPTARFFRVPRRRGFARARGTDLGAVLLAVLARERGRGYPSGLLGLRSAGHPRSHDHAGGATGSALGGNPAPAIAARPPRREGAGEGE